MITGSNIVSRNNMLTGEKTLHDKLGTSDFAAWEEVVIY